MIYGLLAAGVFMLPLIASLIAVNQGRLKPPVPERDAKLAELRQSAEQDQHAHLRKLLLNNLMATAMLLVAGVGSIGLYALFYLGWFGLEIGLAVATLKQAGIANGVIFGFLLPHGLLEVPAFCLAGGVGFRAAWIFARYLRGDGLAREEEVRQMLWTAGVSLGMIVAAALVEAYLTPRVALSYLG